ncbi:polysaccharide deacetylase family protein [Rhodoferax saidenbachensis]|uniref:Caspase-like protein/peptidoglycan/xylan/chitin deacetylase (PgdA/CDA1 family) n=1 Tax=Rhodoferax saidenbachensis TaxID=1484693 RepID=A0ABU1ZK97_9BURK|nr:polysaccharide deacetylase family protein [Rhodoferax saidenbachensis]MDR7305808.1 putative caspase-like protein/peptidoglycan/xylan/chitin deacetylase (PgdA/CDA1 family) [Rhodoferax saidenbachensis]
MAPTPTAAAAPLDTTAVMANLQDVLAAYRKIIVLFADEKTLSPAERTVANQVGQGLFHENRQRVVDMEAHWDTWASSGNPQRFDAIAGVLDYVESGAGLFDADRLAFRELLRSLQASVAKDSSLPAIKLHKRMGEDLDAMAEIERNYEKEIRLVFGRFDTRAIDLKRERWEDYLASLKKLYSREKILKDYGVVLPYPAPKEVARKSKNEDEGEVFGNSLPPKTIVLTFDDGPHGVYTAEIAAILKQYGAPAIFFQVGSNLGVVGADGKAKLNAKTADVSRKLLDAGHTLANHSMTHAQLSKRSGDALKTEILGTDTLLTAVDARRSALFRFPYGARNEEGLDLLATAHLRSIMWNIDSLDWADPVPSSIADRVLQTVAKEGRGIVLFHDIHERTVKALPAVLDRLVAEGYQFAGWDGKGFVVSKGAAPAPTPVAVNPGYSDSWAIVIGIDDYAKWPKLQYAARDAQAIRETLIQKFGFPTEHIVSLTNKEATRTGILAAFHDRLAHSGMKKNDRLFVFFAGHGATRQLSSGRDLGYIIPVDSDPNQIATDAIPMTELQNIAESLTAKHALFVMDACYSGLGLTRGGGSGNFLRDNAKRMGRQMLTAGGADQLVADGGPNGHSVFTWTLLQGLAGKGDLNGDGLITATELAAYVAPAVAAVSRQTPAFGSLPGSEGGDFVFELPADGEFLSGQTTQLSGDAIALNSKLDATRPPAVPASGDKPAAAPATTTVVVKDLQGGEQKIVTPVAVPSSTRQLAQRANDRGLQLYKEKQYALAEAQFTEALKLRPDFALAANNLGFVYYKQDKFAEAARWFENTVKIDPSRAVAYLNLGDAHAKAGNADKAKKAFSTYLELAPSGPGATYAKQQVEKG